MNATPRPGFWRPALLLCVLLIVVAAPQAALLPLLDRDEPRFAEASREMLESRDFTVPTFNDAPRYAKPPLIYWCQAASFLIFGKNAFAARLPSLLAVAGTALLLLAWGRALGSHQAGLIAALAYALCLQVMQQGRVATADALLVFFMTLAGFAGWRLLDLVRTGHGSWNLWGTLLALALGGGFLAKGPEALLPVVPLLFAARWMGWRGLASILLILALALLLVSIWAIPAYVQTGGAYWREGLGHDVGDRMVTGFQGHGASTFGWYLLSLPLYLLTFWLSALPWSPLILLKAQALRRAGALEGTDRYLLGQAGLIFAVFSLMVTKLPHYTLPAFPFLALLFARRWLGARLDPAVPLRTLVICGLGLALLAVVLIPWGLRQGWTPSPVARLIEQAAHDRSLAVRGQVPALPFALVDFREPNSVWEIKRAVEPWMQRDEVTDQAVAMISEDEVMAYFQRPGARAAILTANLWNRLEPGIDPQAPTGKFILKPSWHVYQASGFNAARLRRIDLVLVVKPAR